MGKRIVSVITESDLLFRKIELLLRNECRVHRGHIEFADTVFFDLDSIAAEPPDGAILITRSSESYPGAISNPPELLKIREAALSDKKSRPHLLLSPDRREAYLGDRQIKLTDAEYRMLGQLVTAKGEFVSKNDLLHSVWDEETDPGVVNVYIHYLRGKLEAEGEKVIFSSRLHGYKIDERFLV